MASDGGGVPNSKQHARPKKPYDRGTSIVRRMRETMKDMMSPSWLIDLVHSVRKPPQPTPSAQLMNNVSQQAPASRNQTMCSEVRNTHTAFVPINEASASSGSSPSSQAATFRLSSDSPQFSRFPTMQGQSTCMSGQTVYSSAAVYTQPHPEYTQVSGNFAQPKGDDQSEVSEYSISTSGCSSLVPHPDQRDYQRDILQLSESKIVQMRQELGGSVTPSKEIDPPTPRQTGALDGRNVSKLSVSNNNKSFLWSSTARPSRPSRPQPPAKSQRPAFNVSIFGSPIQNASTRRHELGKDYQQSPYYPGKTTFGGAAAHRKNRLKHSSPYHSPLTKRQVTARPLNNSTLGGVTSSTAKRILDTLEKMSTPIKDAKKIPSYNSSLVDSPMSFTPGNYRRRSLPMHHQNRSPSEPPPVTGLAPPTMAPVMRNLQGPTSQFTPHVSPQYCTRATAPERGVDSLRQGGSDGGARTGKMKRERGQHYSSKKVDQEEEVELPTLPTSFTLPIGSMPTISFGNNLMPSDTSNTATSTQPSRSAVSANPSSPLFRFSSPILKEGGNTLGVVSSPTSNRSFQFSSPITVDKPSTVNTTRSSMSHLAPFSNTSFSSSPSLAFSYKVDSAKLKMKSPPSSVPVPEPGGFSPAKVLAAGSVMDFLSKSASNTPSDRTGDSKVSGGATSDLSSLFKKPAGSWDCPMCMIQNKAEVNKCVACNTSKPSSTADDGAIKKTIAFGVTPGTQSLGSLFKTPAGSWECPTCMIQNKADVAKCVACETAKPKASNSHVAAPSSNEMSAPVGGNSLAAMFKKPSGSWECPTCMVQNSSTHDVCPACSTARPGAPSKSADEPRKMSSSPLPPLTGPSLASQFAKPAGSWDCDTCMVTNKGQSNKCIACETPRPGTTSTTTNFTSPGGFKFGTTGGLVLTSTTMTTNSTGATPVFSFGTTLPTSKPTDTTDKSLDGGFKFSQGSSAPKDFGSAGEFKFGESSVSASSSTGFKLSNSSSNVIPAKPTEGLAKTVPFGGVQFGQSAAPPVDNSSQFVAKAPSGGFKFDAAAASSSGAAAKTSESAQPTTSSTAGLFDQTGNTASLSSSGVKFGEIASGTVKATGVAATTTAPSFGGFSATTTNSSPSGTQLKQPSAGGFSFGQPASVAPDASNNTTSPKKGGFQFGASSTTAAFTNPVSSEVKIGGFSFGGSAKISDTKSQSGSVAGGFSFGGATKTSETKTVSGNSAAGGFSFGANTKTSDAKTGSTGTAGGFNFGPSAKTSETAEKAATSPAGTFSPMVMTPGTPNIAGFQFPTTLSTSTATTTEQSKSVFGSGAASSTSKPQHGGFTFGGAAATSVPSGGKEASSTPSTFTFAGSAASTAGTDTGFAFRKRASDDNDAPVKRSKGFGGAGGFVFGGANTTTSASASASPFGAGATGFGSTTPVFGATTTNTAATTFNPPAFGATTSIAPGAGSMFAAPAAPPAFGAPQAATSLGAKTPFQFGATPTTTGMFSFGGSQPAQSTSAPKPSGGFPFGGQSQPTTLGVGAPAPQQSAPSFNFSATPNINFGASQNASPAAPFQFGAQPGAATGASNSFSINRAPAGSSIANRRIKRAVRKIKK